MERNTNSPLYSHLPRGEEKQMKQIKQTIRKWLIRWGFITPYNKFSNGVEY